MGLEWLLVAVVLVAALWPLRLKLRSPGICAALLLLLGLMIAGARFYQRHVERRTESRQQLLARTPTEGRPDGYVSSTTCRACHPDQYDSWHRSYHRTMTQYATPETVRGPFDKVILTLANERYALERRGDEFWVEMVDPDWRSAQALQRPGRRGETPILSEPDPPRSAKRVGMLTGSHFMQAYWVSSEVGNEQFSFPFTYLFEAKRWVPRNDVFLLPPETAHMQQVWNLNCINCHATAGQPRKDPQTQISASRVAELGIACEACHGPAADHIRAHGNPFERYRQHSAKQPDPTIFNPARQTHEKASEMCSQCHAIRYNNKRAEWITNGFSYRPGQDLEDDRPVPRYTNLAINAQLPPEKREDLNMWHGSFWRDGMVRVSGREFNGLIESPCYQRGQLSCLSCHSMHQSDPDDQLAAGMSGNPACSQCHSGLAKNIAAHTHHRAESTGSLCYNCHMPHTTYGLLKAIRSHQIDSPTVAASLDSGRPNACNLCHLDKTLGWSAQHLAQWYGQPEPSLTADEKQVAASVLWLLRGDAGQRALIAWHMGWEPAVQVAGRDWLAPYLAETLVDGYAAVRYIGQRSLKRQPTFQNLNYDYIGSRAHLEQTRRQVLDLWRARPNLPRRESVLVNTSGVLQEEKIAALLRERDQRPVQLLE